MTDDEEKRLKLELLAADLSLRRKQEFWETPRNIAILVGATAAIAAGIGFWLGRETTTPPPPNFSPVQHDSVFAGITPATFIDAVETSGIVVIAAALIYVVIRLDRALTTTARELKGAIGQQQAITEVINRVWARIEQIETRLGGAGRKNDDPPLPGG